MKGYQWGNGSGKEEKKVGGESGWEAVCRVEGNKGGETGQL